MPSASYKSQVSFGFESLVHNCPYGLKNLPYSPVLYRLLEVNIEKNDRMTMRKLKVHFFPIFFVFYLLARRLKMKCRISKLYDQKQNLQDTLLRLPFVLSFDHNLIIL